MKLYDVPRRSFIKLKEVEREELILFFDHIDGMYSYNVNEDGKLVHVVAWSEVEVLEPTKELKDRFKNAGLNIN